MRGSALSGWLGFGVALGAGMAGQTVSADGVAIRYDDSGVGAPALVFVHGWSCDRRYWRGQLGPLAARHRVVALDLAGHGESGTGRSDWTMHAFGEDVAAVVEHLRVAQAVLIGHSMGGDVIVEAASLLGDRVRGLVWVDVYDGLDEPSSDEAVARFSASLRDEFTAAVATFVATMFSPGADPTLVECVTTDMAGAPAAIAIPVAEHAMANGQVMPGLVRKLQIPIVAINSDWLPPDVESLSRYGVQVLTMAGVGHFAMLEDPARFNELLATVVDAFTPKPSE